MFLLTLAFSLSVTTFGVRRLKADDCVYDYMHQVGGSIAPCEYKPNVVASVTIGDAAVSAFNIDGAHLESKGAMKYLKDLNGNSNFIKCSSPECPELSIS